MKRDEVLEKLNFKVPPTKLKRVIISTDLNNEADDHFAVMHHLLTPSSDIRAIIAAHYEWRPAEAKKELVESNKNNKSVEKLVEIRAKDFQNTMNLSFEVGEKLLKLANIDDVKLLHGSVNAMEDINNITSNEGSDFIIEEAMKDDDKPLFVAVLGSITDLAIAYLKEPRIAERVTAVWIGGGEYPLGGYEFNLKQDVLAANVLLKSPMNIWQIPCNVYRMIEVSQAELSDHIRPCGELGEYLCDQMIEHNHKVSTFANLYQFPHGETWCLGDNPTVSVLLQATNRKCWTEVDAPIVNEDLTYKFGEINKKIRVYDYVDARLTLSDFFSKMKKCYGVSIN